MVKGGHTTRHCIDFQTAPNARRVIGKIQAITNSLAFLQREPLGSPKSGYISEAPAAFILYDGLREATMAADNYNSTFAANVITTQLFLTDVPNEENQNMTLGVHGFEDISTTISPYYMSCAKAYMNGFISQQAHLSTLTVQGSIKVEKLSLFGSKAFTPLAGVCALAALVMAFVQILHVHSPFDLEHVQRALLEDSEKRKSVS